MMRGLGGSCRSSYCECYSHDILAETVLISVSKSLAEPPATTPCRCCRATGSRYGASEEWFLLAIPDAHSALPVTAHGASQFL